MAEDRTCNECGAALPVSAPFGLCPRCLVQMGLELVPAAPGGSQPVKLEAQSPPQPRLGAETIRYFGDYELLEEIARGGMGVVYKARQVSLNRIVAVKMLLFGKFSSDEFVRRFRAEAEAVASLRHPHIVAIHEIGEHQGHHYFSMDYVAGQNLAERAKDIPLPPELAAEYLKTIADAIHYAHQHGVLHRDLKPSNVLIDALDQPHITDFGLAKRLGHDSNLTLRGDLLGTPNYMAPEQANRAQNEVSVATDVYSLGAMLYYLLTGRPPFLAESVPETLRLVLDSEPVPPRVLNQEVPRDLQTICLKCLGKEPSNRYADAAAVAADLALWQAGKPIAARPAQPVEKIWRWCRRQPALASLLGMVLMLLACIAVGSSWMLLREKQARENAAKEATRNRQLADGFQCLLTNLSGSAVLSKDPAFRAALVKAAEGMLGSGITNTPDVEVALGFSITEIYHAMGLYPQMAVIAEENLRLTRTVVRNPDLLLPRALTMLGDARMHQGKLEEAEALFRDGLARREDMVQGPDEQTEGYRTMLAHVLQREGKLKEAEALCRQALAAVIQIHGPTHAQVANVMDNLALVLHDRGDLAAAKEMNLEVLAMRRKVFGDEHEDVATSLNNLARVLFRLKQFAEAEARYRECLAMRRKLLGPEHSAVATCLHNLAVVLNAEDFQKEAETNFTEALEIRRKVNGPEDPVVVQTLNGLGAVFQAEGKNEQAEASWREAMTLSRKIWPNDPSKWIRDFR